MKMSKRALWVLLILPSVVILTWIGTSSGLVQTHPSSRAMTEWFYADGIIQPDDVNPKETMKGIWAPAKEWMVIFNLGSQETTVTATFYFEDQPPRQQKQKLPAHASGYIVVQNISEVVPPKKLYGVRVQSEVPVLVQPTRAEYEPNNPVTAAMASSIAYPGPLGQRETRWAYADGIVISSNNALEEWEWISILNPSPSRDAEVKILFNFVGEQKTHAITVPAERLRTVDLFNLSIVPKNKLFGAIIESDVPVVVEEVRRCYTRQIPVIMSMFACLAYPIGDREVH